ncbi:MAG: aminopeptidase P family protein [Maricaulaceae bacterium]|jgi:Xaa-Pro aminopeptidase
MLQTFDVKGGPAVGRRNLPKLRRAMAKAGLDGLIVPHEDEYQNEYLPAANDRLGWATGFTGSAGAALVFADTALLFVDGRYTLQAEAQTDPKLFEIRDLVAEGVKGWLAEHAPEGAKIGYDPKLLSPEAVERLEKAAAARGAALIALDDNPVDTAWTDRPDPPRAKILPHPLEFAGEAHADKRARLAESLKKDGVDAAVLTSPASLAWLLNIRGGDVAHTPLPLGSGVLHANGRAALYVDPEKVTDEVREHLGGEVEIRPEAAFADAFHALSGKTVRVDPATASAWVVGRLEAAGAKIDKGADPTTLPRACKNAAEIDGAKQAHVRDGAALARFLHWLATDAQDGHVDEIEAATTLENFRRRSNKLKDLSFESISGAGPNGAIVHYRVTTKTNKKLKRGSLYLIDSGGQYPDGTTDVTRTVAIGRPKKEMKERFTLVLKGHIALARVRFPEGVTGAHLDVLAREHLWAAGLDFDHGTGHGVGSYLSVHEGPQRISRQLSDVPLRPGMIISNEPGYYKTGGYGIRIENLQFVAPPAPIEGGERQMLGFETLTLAPIDRTLIVKSMLEKVERARIDAYHARVLEEIGPLVEDDVRAWLTEACAPL